VRMKKTNKPKKNVVKKNILITNIVIICLSLFSSVITISYFIYTAADPIRIFWGTVVFTVIYYFIFKNLIKFYEKALSFFISKFTGKKSKDIQTIIPISWLFPSIIALILVLILFIKTNYFEWTVITSGRAHTIPSDKIITELNSRFIPLIVIFYAFSGLFIQTFYLNKLKKISWLSSLLSSFVTITIFVFIINVIKNTLLAILVSL